MPEITGDSTRHRTGANALWDEVCRLRRLLRQGEWLADQLECLAVETHPALYQESRQWRRDVGEALGEYKFDSPGDPDQGSLPLEE